MEFKIRFLLMPAVASFLFIFTVALLMQNADASLSESWENVKNSDAVQQVQKVGMSNSHSLISSLLELAFQSNMKERNGQGKNVFVCLILVIIHLYNRVQKNFYMAPPLLCQTIIISNLPQ